MFANVLHSNSFIVL